MQNQYRCTIHLASQILETDGYRVSLQGNFFGRNHTYITFAEYNPRKHSKYEPGQLWTEALPSSFGVRLIYSLTKGVSKTASENNGNKPECTMWTSSVRMQSQCLSILTFPGLQRGLALEHLSSILLICITFSCAMDNVQLDCLYSCFFSKK